MIGKFFSYGLANIVSAAIGFFAIPILAREMGPVAFGKAAIFVSVVWVFNTVICLNLTAAFNVKFKKLPRQEFRQFFSTASSLIFLQCVFALLVILLFGNMLPALVGLELPILLIALVGSQFNIYFQLFQSYQMMRGQAHYYGMLQILNAAIAAGLSVVLVYYLSDPLYGRVVGLFVAYVLLGLSGILVLRHAGLLFFTFDRKRVPEIYAFTIPLLPHMAGVALFAVVDRFLSHHLAGEERAGVYLGAVTLAAVAAIVISAVNRTMVPYIYDLLAKFDHDTMHKITRLYAAYILVSMIAVLPIYFLSNFAANIMLGAEFSGAGNYLRWLLVGQLFFGCYTLGSNILVYFERTALLSIITVMTGAINVALIYVGFGLFGLVGFAYAFAFAMLLRFLIVTFFALTQLRTLTLEYRLKEA